MWSGKWERCFIIKHVARAEVPLHLKERLPTSVYMFRYMLHTAYKPRWLFFTDVHKYQFVTLMALMNVSVM